MEDRVWVAGPSNILGLLVEKMDSLHGQVVESTGDTRVLVCHGDTERAGVIWQGYESSDALYWRGSAQLRLS